MNVAVTIMQATNWSKFSIEDWLRQFGAWINGDTQTIVKMVKSLPAKRLNQEQKDILLASYLGGSVQRSRAMKKGIACEITDNEARAVQRIILDLQDHPSEILREWMAVIWSHYVMGDSLRDVAERHGTSLHQVRQDIKCGLSFIGGRYPSLHADLLKK